MYETTTELIRRTLQERAAAVTPETLRGLGPIDARHTRRAFAVPRWLAPVAAAAAVAVLTAGVIVLRGPAATDDPVTGPGGSAAPSGMELPDRLLRQLVYRAAVALTGSGDRSATAEAVATTFRQAEIAIGYAGHAASPPGETPVWLVQLRGNFTCDMCPRPQGADAPTGTAITLILDASAEQQYSFALRDMPVDLAALGTVVPLGTPGRTQEVPPLFETVTD